MLDLLMIQEEETGLTYFEHEGKHTKLNNTHASIFSGFLSAVRQVTQEMYMGRLTQISTEFHHCVIEKGKESVSIIIFDAEDNVEFWKEFAKVVTANFEEEYPDAKKNISNTYKFQNFKKKYKKLYKDYAKNYVPAVLPDSCN
jgi:Tol biopolymer transport system component